MRFCLLEIPNREDEVLLKMPAIAPQNGIITEHCFLNRDRTDFIIIDKGSMQCHEWAVLTGTRFSFLAGLKNKCRFLLSLSETGGSQSLQVTRVLTEKINPMTYQNLHVIPI